MHVGSVASVKRLKFAVHTSGALAFATKLYLKRNRVVLLVMVNTEPEVAIEAANGDPATVGSSSATYSPLVAFPLDVET